MATPISESIKPLYKLEIYDTTPTLIYTIEDELIDLRVKSNLTSNIGNFSFSLPISADGLEYSYNDIQPFWWAKIFLGWNDLPATSTFTGKIERISTPIAIPSGFRRVFKGKDIGSILHRNLKGTRYWEAEDASVIVNEVATDLGLITKIGTADSGDTTHTVDTERTEAEDYWNGQYIQYITGPNKSLNRLITDFVAATDTITHAAFPNAVAAGHEYLILPTVNIEEDTTDVTLIIDYDRHDSYFNILKAVSDYWYNAGTQLQYDFYVDADSNLVWKARPLRTTGVETVILSDLASYTMVRELQAVKNWIHIYGAKLRGYPPDKDLFTDWQFPTQPESDLDANAAAAQKVISVIDSSAFSVDDHVQIIDNNGSEENIIASINGGLNDITMVNDLANAYTIAANAWCMYIPGWWSGTGNGTVSGDAANEVIGTYCVEHNTTVNDNDGRMAFLLPSLSPNDLTVDCGYYPTLVFQLKIEAGQNFSGAVTVSLEDTSNRLAYRNITVQPDSTWHVIQLAVGDKNVEQWTYDTNPTAFEWDKVQELEILSSFAGVGTGKFWCDGLHWNGRPYYGHASDATSYNAYGYRDVMLEDPALMSNTECVRRAETILMQQKTPPYRLDFQVPGNTNLLIGDRIPITLLPEAMTNVDFDLLTVEHVLAGKPIGWRTNVTALSTGTLRTAPATNTLEYLVGRKVENSEVAKGWLMVR